MKQIIELKRNLANPDFVMAQFEKSADENILFVNPSLSGKHLYKMLLPYLHQESGVAIITLENNETFKTFKRKSEANAWISENIKEEDYQFYGLKEIHKATAITSLSDFSVKEQLLGYESLSILSPQNTSGDQMTMIEWADRIVFPFVAQNLCEIYDHIREINPDCKVEFCIDFNCWELPESHPLKSVFDEEIVLANIQDNMYFSDAVIVSNEAMQQYLIQKLGQLAKTTYLGVPRVAVNERIEIYCEPFIIGEKAVFENVDYDPKEIIFKVPVAETPIVDNTEKTPLKDDKKGVKLQTEKPITKPSVVISKKKKDNKPKIVIKKVVKKTPPKKKKRK